MIDKGKGRAARERLRDGQLLADALLAIEAEEAKAAGKLGYMARALVQATMPHRSIPEVSFQRRNGAFMLTMLALPQVGLPYGSIPRLLLAWMTTEAVRTKEPCLVLGDTLSRFMAELDLIPTGGRWGTITRLKAQMTRLFTCTVSLDYEDDGSRAGMGFRLVKDYRLLWHPKNPQQAALWQSTVTLSRDFFDEVIAAPVPVDMRALKALRRSPMALDIYCWLTYRMSYLDHKTEIPWEALAIQFGAGYELCRQFKQSFLEQLQKVCVVYQEARVEEGERGLILRPSRPHVPRLSR